MTSLESQHLGTRTPYWDNAKGILIAFVVLGHFLWAYFGFGLSGYLVSFIYLFHMPAFTLVSGFLSKSERSRAPETLAKLLLMYVMFNFPIMIFSYVTFGTALSLITPSYSFWYLLSLVWWRLVAAHIQGIRSIVLLSLLIAFAIGFWGDVSNVFALSRTIAFLPFFLIGYKLSVPDINAFIQNATWQNRLMGLVLLLSAIVLSAVLVFGQPDLFSQADLLMWGYESALGVFVRVTIFCIAGLTIVGGALLVPNQPLRLLTRWGRNSLSIFVLHRFVTLGFLLIFPVTNYTDAYLLYAALASLLTLMFLGSERVSRRLGIILNRTAWHLLCTTKRDSNGSTVLARAVNGTLVVILLLPTIGITMSLSGSSVLGRQRSAGQNHAMLSNEQRVALESAVSIAFVGDLILLQDQVREAYSSTTQEYVFDPMFEYASRYLKQADIAIGVLEGPLAGEEAGYSTSNYGDGLPLYLNYPDSFARAVQESGIDLVSTANNHVLDKGEQGALRTLDVLDQIGLLHVGSYRDAEEKQTPTIVDVNGIRIGILAYTYGSNYYREDYFLQENPSITSIIVPRSSRYFAQVKAAVQEDLQRLNDLAAPPDLIAVIPHMGTQFSHETDIFQETWNAIFVEAGANIILGNHAHAVQPVEFRIATDDAGRERLAVIVNCPGNFANSFVEHNGDATAIAEVYIDPESKKIIGAAVIPMYTQAPSGGSFRALPIYSILTDPVLQQEVSRYEMKRVAEVQALVTSVMLGVEVPLDQAESRHYLLPEGYFRQPVEELELTEAMLASPLYDLLSNARSVCFVGDSITAGTKNGGYSWYEPMMAAIPDVAVRREAWEGATSVTLTQNAERIAANASDLYVIAIGTNDVRYRNRRTCAMDSDSYIENIDLLVQSIRGTNPTSTFVFISPWHSQANDPFTSLSVQERDSMLRDYATALESYATERGFLFIDPNPAITQVLLRDAPSTYLLDHIHPNVRAGIALYSEMVLSY